MLRPLLPAGLAQEGGASSSTDAAFVQTRPVKPEIQPSGPVFRTMVKETTTLELEDSPRHPEPDVTTRVGDLHGGEVPGSEEHGGEDCAHEGGRGRPAADQICDDCEGEACAAEPNESVSERQRCEQMDSGAQTVPAMLRVCGPLMLPSDRVEGIHGSRVSKGRWNSGERPGTDNGRTGSCTKR